MPGAGGGSSRLPHGLEATEPISDRWVRLAVALRGNTAAERVVVGGAAGAVVGAWLSCAAIPLDWDRPWQRFPVPPTVGAVLGHAAGTLLALTLEELPQIANTLCGSSRGRRFAGGVKKTA